MNDQSPRNSIPPTPQNICAIVVSFNPDPSLKANLDSIINQVAYVILVDNTSAEESLSQITTAINPRLAVIANRKNLGIATALNLGIARAKSLGYQWVLTMDQDTAAHADLIDNLQTIYNEYPDREKIGTLAANFIDANRHRLFAGTSSTHNSYLEQAVAITAGSLIPMAALNNVGAFRDEFFIDFVDHEFSLRLRRRGWKILYSRKPLIDHQIGAPVRHRFLWMRPTTSNHSAVRRYYITRNRLITAAEYYDTQPRAVVTDLCRVAGEAVAVLAFEPDRFEKFKAILAGVRDAITKRGGPRHAQTALSYGAPSGRGH